MAEGHKHHHHHHHSRHSQSAPDVEVAQPMEPPTQAQPVMNQGAPMQMNQMMPPAGGGQQGKFSHMNTKVGKFLLAGVVFGLMAVTLTSAGYDNSRYLGTTCSKSARESFSKCTEDCALTCGLDNSEYHSCAVAASKYKGTDGPSCPSAYLAIPPVFLIGIAWAIILIVFIVLNMVPPKPQHQQMSFIGGVVSAALFLLSAFLLLVYVVWIFASKKPCKLSDDSPEISCMVLKNSLFMLWFFLFGMIFAGAAGAFLLVMALSIRKGRVGPY